MTVRHPRFWIAFVSTAAVLFFVLGDVRRKSPGPIAAVHAQEPKLLGDNSCSQCHGGWFTSMPEACLGCHSDIDVQISGGAGLHGVLEENQVMLCALCHSDHHGPDFAIVNRQSFAQAGVPNSDEFEHRIVGFPMDGRHLDLDCKTCHVNADQTILPKGERRFLGLDSSCSACHEDPHSGRYALGCAKCHSQEAFDKLGSLGHEDILPLVGGHGDLSCRECHAKDSLRSLEVLGEAAPPSPRECLDCHESPHRPEFIDGVAQLVSLTDSSSCRTCHRAEHVSFRDEEMEVTPELHAPSGFSLAVPHERLSCEDCHPRVARSFADAYPGRQADDCQQCHQDPHGGQFDEATYAQGCIDCHSRHEFDPHNFTVERHRVTAFPLTGAHFETDCKTCHDVFAPRAGRSSAPVSARVFRGTPSRCENCHSDAHRGAFDKFASSLRRAEQGTCATCHLTTSFSEMPDEGFDHARWTGFPVEGAHAQVECESCHPRSSRADEFGRRFGRSAEHFGPMKDGGKGCVTCHTDPHQGEFDTPRHPRVVNGKTGCARCHTQISFRVFAERFAHRRWTGFALQGAHGEISCSECHAPLRRPDESGRTWARAKGQDCSNCHVDTHAGQFREEGSTDCQRCHKSATSFSDLSFRHNLDSRFRLGEAHEALACSACHFPVQQGSLQVIRYKPLGTRCVDCHGEQEERFRRRTGRRR